MRFQCKCGEILSNGISPNDIELRVYTDEEWDELTNLGMIDSVDIPFPKLDVWRCPVCKRVYVFDGDDLKYQYVLEEKIFKIKKALYHKTGNQVIKP